MAVGDWSPDNSRTLDEWRLIRQVQRELAELTQQRQRAERIDRRIALNAIAKELRADDYAITRRVIARREQSAQARTAREITAYSTSVAERMLGL